MDIIEFTLKISNKEFPMLKNLKKKELEKYIIKIFKTGYHIHFPPETKIEQHVEYNGLIEKIDTIKNEIKVEINNSNINDKISSLELNLTKLIGLSSNSCKKGNFAENLLEEIFSKRYGDIQFERKSNVPHSGDAWLYLPDGKIIILESKNYTTTVGKDEITKLQSDMINHHIKWGLLTSFNSNIQGMKELDFHTFTHSNNTYCVIMISNLTTDIHKLDLGLQIIRKLICSFDNLPMFPWVVSDISQSLNDLNAIIQKNYVLRDTYYNMERDIQKLLSGYHVNLRDYQYDIEKKINEIIGKIKSSIVESLDGNNAEPNNQIVLDKFQDKKILPIIVRLVDIAQNKKWKFTFNNNDEKDWIITCKNEDIGSIKILQKKILFTHNQNELTLTLAIGKDKENIKNLEIITNI